MRSGNWWITVLLMVVVASVGDREGPRAVTAVSRQGDNSVSQADVIRFVTPIHRFEV